MDIQQMRNTLYNLSNLEICFKELSPNVNYHDYQTYQRFLDHYFIQKHNLQTVYWQPASAHPEVHIPRFLTNYDELKEEWLFFTDKIILMKQINLPFDHMLTNTFFQFIYILDGIATLELETQKIQLQTGDFFILFPNIKHLLNTEDESIVINILIQRKHLYSENFNIFEKFPFIKSKPSNQHFGTVTCAIPNETTYILFHTLKNQDIQNVVLQMFAEYLQHMQYKEQVMDSLLTLLFAFLMRYQSEQIEFSSPITAVQRAFAKINQYCKANCCQCTLNSASKNLNFSKQYINRVVKEVTGDTFTSMLTTLKLNMVKKYLLETHLTLSSVAEITGFSDASHLSRVFKSYEGISPSVYREQNTITDE